MTFRESRTSQKLTVRPVLDHHVPAAVFADFLGLFVRDMNFFQSLFSLKNSVMKIGIKVLNDSLPADLAVRDSVQKGLHVGSEHGIHDRGKCLSHDSVDNLAQFRHIEVLFLFDNIAAGKDGGNGRRVSAGTSDSLLFQRANQGCLCEMRCRLCKVLSGVKFLQGQDTVLVQSLSQHRTLLFFILDIDLLIAVEQKSGGGNCEELVREFTTLCPGDILTGRRSAGDPDLGRLIPGRSHAACHEPFPDQLIEAELVPGERILDLDRQAGHVCRADRLMGILNFCVLLFLPGLLQNIFLPVVFPDKGGSGRLRLIGHAHAVCSQVCDQSDRSLSLDLNALIELLGDAHRLLGGKIQHLTCLLLQRGGGERQR